MFINKNFNIKDLLRLTGVHLIWLTLWATFVTVVYEYLHWEWLHIPWLPLSIIGTAVAFYVGFKNNSAYDRLWEARKIWDAIISSSRMWGANVRAYVGNQFTEENVAIEQLYLIHKKLLYRHIGWLYAFRSQLLIPTPWEHISQGKLLKKITERRKKRYGTNLSQDGITEQELEAFLPSDELQRLVDYKKNFHYLGNTVVAASFSLVFLSSYCLWVWYLNFIIWEKESYGCRFLLPS